MFSEFKTANKFNNIALVFYILIFNLFEDFNLNLCLILKFLLISNDLKRKLFFVFVVDDFDYLSKTTLAKDFKYFVAESYMVVNNNFVVASFIIESTVVSICFRCVHLFICVSNKINFFEVKYFTIFKNSELCIHVQFQCFPWKHWKTISTISF